MAGHSAAVEAQLIAFLHNGAATKFDWLSCNCGFWVCEWIAQRRGIDPVAHLRDRFDQSSRFQHYVARKGGNEAFSRLIAAQAALVEINQPKRGDVGLIVTASGASMAICLGDGRWAAKSPHGVLIAAFEHIAAWAI